MDINIFKHIDFNIPFKEGIDKISAGVYHTGCVVDKEKVYLWGRATAINFDVPTLCNLDSGLSPAKLNKNKSLTAVKELKIGNDFVMVVTKKNEIFMMGSNSKGQLGLKNVSQTIVFEKLNLLSSTENNDTKNDNTSTNGSNIPYKIKHADLGFEFALVVIEYESKDNELGSNEVYGWGSNEYGQLGLSDIDFVRSPTYIPNLSCMNKISCGGYHCLGIEITHISQEEAQQQKLESSKKDMNKLKEGRSQPRFNNRPGSMGFANNDEDSKIDPAITPPKQIKKRELSVDAIKCQEKQTSGKNCVENAMIMMKNILEVMPLSSTLKNDYRFIKEKNQIISELNSKSKQLEDIFRRNEQKIEELKKQEKELSQRVDVKKDDKDDPEMSRGFTNSFEILKSEIQTVEEIGKGTFGVVYKGLWRKEMVAIKVIRAEFLSQEDSIKSFHEECMFLKNLRHPNVLLFMGACTKGPDYFIVTEMCENGNLFDLLHMKKFVPISWDDKRRLALEICYGMNYLHSFKPPILHRDLKSMNILLNKFWQVKLADFGNTRFLETHMTKQKGTFQWMAPEVICNTTYTEKADVFSFGIIMAELMSRTAPYYGIEKKVVAQSVASKPNYRPQILSNCPKDWQILMKRCWDHSPLKRPNFNEIIEMLLKANLK